MTAELVERARAGDGDAFAALVAPYRRELEVHCYRILGSVQDAEDALQETLLAAWNGLAGYEQRASLRTWLYRIATTRCLNALRSASRRPPPMDARGAGPTRPAPTRLGEIVWLEPYPDLLLDELPDAAPGPEARYELREAISLAFVTAVQMLPPRQRVVLVLRDVLGYPAREVAAMLDVTEESVTSALKRARAAVRQEVPTPDAAPPPPDSPAERDVLVRLASAFEEGDVDGVVTLLTDDVWLRMPPAPLEYQGRDLARRFLGDVVFAGGQRYRLVPTRTNRQPAFGVYIPDARTGTAHANGLLVITLAGERVSAITRFETGALARLGLPRTIPN